MSTLADRLADAWMDGLAGNAQRLALFHASFPIELQALGGGRPVHAFARDERELIAAMEQLDALGEREGIYILANQLEPAHARAPFGVWRPMEKGLATTDEDIAARTVFYVDLDVVRPTKTSATDEQVELAHQRAEAVWAWLLEAGVSEYALGLGHSGNGRAILIALDHLPNTPALSDLIVRCLHGLARRFSDDRVKVDVKVGDAKRLCPAWGTTKRKGPANDPERPHRETVLVCEDIPDRLSLEELGQLADKLDPPQPKRAPAPAPQEERARERTVVTPSSRASAYLATMEPAISGSGGHQATWRAALAMVRGFGLDPAEALSLLEREYNPRCAPPWSRAELEHKVTSAAADSSMPVGYLLVDQPGPTPRSGKTAMPAHAGTDGDARAEVLVITSELHHLVDKAAGILAADRNIYERDAQLVRVVRSAGDKFAGRGTPTIRAASSATVLERLTRGALWGKRRADGEIAHGLPPREVVDAVRDRGTWRGMRSLSGILEAPSLRPDGTVIDRPGYDAATKYLYVPSMTFPEVPAEPSLEDAQAALAKLREPFADFPHATEEGKMVAIAAVLTLIARPAIRGACPSFVFDASTRGSGKSLQQHAISIIATGRDATLMNFPIGRAKLEELEKVLGGYALLGARLITFDNVVDGYGGGPLDRALSAPDTVSLRVLGKSEIREMPWNAVVTASGNNVFFDGDTGRRCMVSRLESDLENPEDRSDFAIADLRAWTRAHRAELVRAALTLLRAYIVAGRPTTTKTWGSFAEWAALIPAAIVWAGGADPMLARPAEDGERQDPEKQALVGIIEGLARLDPTGSGLTARGILAALYPAERVRGEAPPDGFDDLRETIETLVPTSSGRVPSVVAFGYKLRHMKGRVVGGRSLASHMHRSAVQQWSVVRAGDAGDAGDGLRRTQPTAPPRAGDAGDGCEADQKAAAASVQGMRRGYAGDKNGHPMHSKPFESGAFSADAGDAGDGVVLRPRPRAYTHTRASAHTRAGGPADSSPASPASPAPSDGGFGTPPSQPTEDEPWEAFLDDGWSP